MSVRRVYRLLLGFLAGLAVICGSALPLLANSPPAAIAAGPSETRGVWLTNVDSSVLFSSAAMRDAIAQLQGFHFNTVYPTVWSWGYTLFPSQVARREIGYQQGLYPDLEAQGRNEALEAAQGDRDLLLELVELSHRQGLSVIPWFEFGFMAPANSPLAQRHPDWLSQRQGQLPASRQALEGRHQRVWLNPFHPQVQQFILDLAAELMANYDVDGLQLDDHFGLPVEFGYDPYTVALYQQEHGGRRPPANPHDPRWMRWRADKLSGFLARLFWLVKAQRPQAVLSLSPNPAGFAYSHFLQDWPRWEQDGYVEELIVQVYRDSLSGFDAALREPALVRARQHIPTSIGVLSGLKDLPVPISLVAQKVQAVRAQAYAGTAFFFYDTLWQGAGESREQRQAAVRSLFPTARPRARLPWP